MPTASGKVAATSLDVARRAGLSRSTVSQILNGNESQFTPATRERVIEAAAALGYRPSRAGRALVTGVSDIIVVAVPNVTFGRHLQDVVDRIARASASRGMSVVVRYTGDDSATTLATVLDLRPVAVVDLGVFYSVEARREIEARGIRVVPDLSTLESVEENPNHLIGRVQAHHLLEQPERQIVVAVLEDDRPDVFGPDRVQGVLDEVRRLGGRLPTIITVALDRSSATQKLRAVVDQTTGVPLGVCCYNDDVAIAILAAARELGLSVPDQIAVVGVDFTAVGQLVDPPITSVAIDYEAAITFMLSELDVLGGPIGHPAITPERASALVSLHVGGSS